jgi:hypothetical protein
MRRRVLIAQGILSSISAVLFTSTGWLMGTRTLRMPDPTPENPPGQTWTAPVRVTCVGCGCGGICQVNYKCNADHSVTQVQFGRCTCNNPPCSSGYCSIEYSPTGLTC